jgi:hypothetical protein
MDIAASSTELYITPVSVQIIFFRFAARILAFASAVWVRPW